jgi:urease accessory protein
MKAGVHIQVAASGTSSFLKNAFFETPFKIMNITEDKRIHPLHLMLMSSSPGILDNDEYCFKVNVESGAGLHLHTQAYQRLFQMKDAASQQMDIHLADNASFVYLPHPTVPHAQSSFTSRNNFFLCSKYSLVFGEILTCGRGLNDERFLFSKYHSISKISINDKLVIKENLLVMPSRINVHSMGQMEGYTHQASFLFLQEEVDMVPLQSALLAFISSEKNIEAGVSSLPVNGLMVRLLGYGAEQLYSCMQQMLSIVKLHTLKTVADEC